MLNYLKFIIKRILIAHCDWKIKKLEQETKRCTRALSLLSDPKVCKALEEYLIEYAKHYYPWR